MKPHFISFFNVMCVQQIESSLALGAVLALSNLALKLTVYPLGFNEIEAVNKW
jgi:hypothetical protein